MCYLENWEIISNGIVFAGGLYEPPPARAIAHHVALCFRHDCPGHYFMLLQLSRFLFCEMPSICVMYFLSAALYFSQFKKSGNAVCPVMISGGNLGCCVLGLVYFLAASRLTFRATRSYSMTLVHLVIGPVIFNSMYDMWHALRKCSLGFQMVEEAGTIAVLLIVTTIVTTLQTWSV